MREISRNNGRLRTNCNRLIYVSGTIQSRKEGSSQSWKFRALYTDLVSWPKYGAEFAGLRLLCEAIWVQPYVTYFRGEIINDCLQRIYFFLSWEFDTNVSKNLPRTNIDLQHIYWCTFHSMQAHIYIYANAILHF